ncbi:serine/threonine-protein kinase PEPKR2 [Tanacetum coccineum]
MDGQILLVLQMSFFFEESRKKPSVMKESGDICKGLDINHLPGNGSLVRLINLTRQIEVAEKILNTSFFWGSFRGHRVVVKKVPRQEYDDYYSKTAEIYRTCYDLDGVERLEFEESDDEFHSIAFEVCAGNLVDVFKDVRDFIKHEQVNIMRELILAVKELNRKHIMHGNVNPQNVLIQSSIRGYRVKLCGLRNNKQIDQGEQLSMHNSEMSILGETLLYIMSDGKSFGQSGYADDGQITLDKFALTDRKPSGIVAESRRIKWLKRTERSGTLAVKK